MVRKAEQGAPSVRKRIVAYVDETMFVEGRGFRVSLVVEGEDGHRPTGTWPYTGAVGETLPWFWGPTIEKARAAADSYNEQRGISKEDAFGIITRSMFPRSRTTRGGRAARKIRKGLR